MRNLANDRPSQFEEGSREANMLAFWIYLCIHSTYIQPCLSELRAPDPDHGAC